jgi:hypothetical protein
MKIYLNGNQITSFSTRTNPSQNQDFILSTLTTTGIGINTDQVGGVSRFNGYISEAIYIDNQALDLLILANLTQTQEYGNLSLTQVLMELLDSI